MLKIAPNIISFSPSGEDEWLKLRVKDITSTDVAALFDASPYMTKYQLFFSKRDKLISQLPDNERMFWGRQLENDR